MRLRLRPRARSNRLWWTLLLILPAAGLLTPGCRAETPEPVSVILLSIDTLRADHLGSYGYPRDTSPNLDAFSEDAIVFQHAIAQAPSTLTSHASMFTSMWPQHHGAYFFNSGLPANVVTLAELLQGAGYQTVSYNGGGRVAAVYGFNRGFDTYHSLGSRREKFSSVLDLALPWLDEHGHDPFFLFLHTYEVHTPYTPEAQYLRLIEAEPYDGSLSGQILRQVLLRQISQGEVEIDQRDADHLVDAYDAEIRSVDDSFKRLVSHLKEAGHYDNLLIIVTENGGAKIGHRAAV